MRRMLHNLNSLSARKKIPARGWIVASFFILSFSIVVGLAGETNTLAWPPPPAEPRIVYVREIASANDIGVKPSFFSRVGKTLTGVGGAEAKKMDRPFGLSLDASGNLLVTDTGLNAVFYLDLSRKKWLRWEAVDGKKFSAPVAAVRSEKLIFVADSATASVMAFDEKGHLHFSITNGLERPTGLALIGDRLLVVDSQQHQISVFDTNGKLLNKWGKRGNGPGEFNYPTHLAVDDKQQIYVTDSMNYRVQVFDGNGKFLRSFGRAGDGPGRFARPKGVAVDRSGHVYVVDAMFNNVQIFDGQGRLLLDFCEPGADAGKLCLPNAIAINSQNEIFVADSYNHRVQEFRYTGRE